jgi:hypothetical protein
MVSVCCVTMAYSKDVWFVQPLLAKSVNLIILVRLLLHLEVVLLVLSLFLVVIYVKINRYAYHVNRGILWMQMYANHALRFSNVLFAQTT